MRKISATYIFPGNQPPLKNGILTCKDDGTILELTNTGGKLHEQSGLEQYSGMLVPGFVNSHCHLKLSHRTPSGKSSLASVLPFLSQESPLFLAQNNYTSKTDIRELKRRREKANTFLVLCPNSNLYIENRLPQVSLFQKKR